MISFYRFRRRVSLSLLAGTLAVPPLVMGAVVGLGMEPANVIEDGPRADPISELVTAAVSGCAQAGRDPVVGVEGRLVSIRCSGLPDMGTAPRVMTRWGMR